MGRAPAALVEDALLKVAAFVAFAVLAAAPAATAESAVVRATVDRQVVGLGDPFLYVVEVHGPPDSTVFAEPGPFVAESPPKRSVSDGGKVVRIEQRLICLDRGCAADGRRRRVALPPVRVISGGARILGAPVTITIEPRVPVTAVKESRVRYRFDDTVRPAGGPSRAAIVALVLLAVVCVAAAAFLLAPGVTRRRTADSGESLRGGLERALRLLRESARRPVPDRRRAADYVARAAETRGSDVAVVDATRVAWSKHDPQPPEVTALADRVETTLGNAS
jgi:hypothetical protein